MNAHIAEVVDSNYKDPPVANRVGRPYPRHYAYIRMPWLANPKNPDPISPHPVPAFLNQQHLDRKDWVPLKPGTRVVVIEVDRSGVNPLGLAIIAYGPQNTDDQYGDLRETVDYHARPGNGGTDKWVDEIEDPVYGPNEDVGRTHEDGMGMGWRTRHPWPNDLTRVRRTDTYPDATVDAMHRTDDSEHYWRFTLPGTNVTYTLEFDAITMTVTLMDNLGNSVVLDSSAMTVVATIVTSISLATGALGFYGATPVAKPTVSGSKNGNAALTSLMTALASLGLVTDTTT